MENVVLTIHLILALLLIGIVLLQRSEGGGLLGGGGGGGGVMSGRAAANAMTKLTWIFAAAFIATSITLTVISAQKSQGNSVVDQDLTDSRTEVPADLVPSLPDTNLLPPTPSDAPATPPPAE